MTKERRDEGHGDFAEDEAPAQRAIGPGKRSGTAGAPGGPPPAYPGKRTLTQHFAPRAGRTPMPTVDDVATQAVENKSAGGGLDGGVRSTMEAHLGMDLADVRVHDDEHAGASAQLMGARAFAHGKDIYLAPNERPTDMALMAHELTHVAQQTGGAAQPQRKVTVGAAGSPAEQQADAVAAGVVGGEKPPMIVDPGAPIQAGQMSVTDFLAQLRAQVEAAASAKFGPLWSITGCHYIEKYFSHYQGRSAKEIERAMKLYAPDAAASGNAQVAIASVTARVKAGMATWEATGQLPADAAKIAPPSAQEDVTAANQPRDAAHAKHECTAACKHAPGEHPIDEANPMLALGAGQPLDSGTASRMGDALGTDVSMARVHTGDEAAQLAREHDATAVTVGQDIAFGSGAYAPGTAVGDALLAHELAHTVQQKGADPSGPIGGESAAAETNADQVAAGAIAQLHGGMTKEAAAAMAISQVMATGLQLQRCSPDNTPSPVVPPSAKGGTKDLFDGAKAPDDKQQAAIDKVLNPTGAGKGAASLPYKQPGFKTDMVAALDTWRKDSTRFNKRLTGPNALKLDMPQVRKTGDAAQKVVSDKYGEFIKASSGGANASHANDPAYKVSDPKVLHPQEDSIDPLPKAEQEEMVRGLVSYAMQQPDGGEPVTAAHNVDLTRGPDKTDYYTVMTDYAKKHHAELAQIQRDWPGEEHPWDGTVYVQLRRSKKADLTAKEKADPKADLNLRFGYWSTFQTLIHEYLHAGAHGKWREVANDANAGQYHIMVEGACEYFTERAYKGIEPNIPTDDALREQVEGKKYPWTPDVLPKWDGYDSRAKVEAMVAAMGGNETNLKLAYFMGHVELVGLGTKWNKDMASEGGNYNVVVDDFFLSTISERTFVSVDDIRAANKFPATQDKVKKGRIQVPGISYHYVVKGDTQASIAAQHGITEAALAKANPLVSTWTTLRDNEQILIPAH